MNVLITKSKLNQINFNNYINNNYLFEKNPFVAVAVSGGPDSMALLFLINNWVKTVKGSVIAIIVNHGLRKNSKDEAKLVQKKINLKKIKTKIISIKNNKIIKKNMNEARNNRYNAITKYCNNENILHLFVGHNFDDNLETFLNRKIAGSDFEGLNSISENVVKNKINILRPLIFYHKKSIYSFNKINNIFFVEDQSNLDFKYTRPIIRSFLNSSIKILQIAKNDFKKIHKVMPFYKFMINNFLIKNLAYFDENIIKFNYQNLVNADKIVIEKIIKKNYSFFFKNLKQIRSKKVEILVEKLLKKNFNKFNLGGMIVKKENKLLIFSAKSL